MEVKIDTNANYIVLTPQSPQLDEKLTEAISQKWTELVKQGHANLIVDLSACSAAAENVMDELAQMHEVFYGENHSLVFTHLKPELRNNLSQHDYFHGINIAPTLVEAVDIVNMEVLERELLGEEGEDLV
ncbi:MAG TPA: hypothetical protein VL098_13400 [Flavipsychrobacter sp.]|nr:hypothetical protein [Flavipsychrobacter sp.]